MAEKNVKIVVETIIKNGEDENKFELIVFGTTAERNGTRYIRYTEISENSEARVLVKYDGKTVTVTRNGEVTIKQFFDITKDSEAMMETPLGMLSIVTRTNKINFIASETESEIELLLNYDLFIQAEETGNYQLKIKTTNIE